MKIAGHPTEQRRRKKHTFKGSGWVTYLLAVAIVGLMFPFGWLLQAVGGQSNWLPVNLHSVLAADYSADPLALHLPAIQLGLIEDILNDSATITPGRFATLEGNLITPVPTATPRPGYPTATLPAPTLPPDTPTPRPVQIASPTPQLASQTPIPSQASSVTPTFPTLYTPTPTQPVSTGYPTRTLPPPPSRTPTPPPTGTTVPSPTDTSRPPTSTVAPPTATLPPPPTRTPHPYPEPTDPPYP